MISNLNASSDAFLANMQRVQRRVEDASRQASSGKRVNVAADAPAEIDTILQLRTAAARNEQIDENLAVARTNADSADGALASANKIMDRARVLAAQGANFTMDATGRQSIAGEVESLLEQMVAVSRSTVQGRYIFGGDDSGEPPYEVDLTAVTGVARLTNSGATQRVEDSAGGSFAASRSAADIFDPHNDDGTIGKGNTFAALNELRLALLANDTTQIQTAAGSLQVAGIHLNTAQAFYGTVQNRIASAANYSASYATQLKTELSQKEDADLASAALLVTQGSLQLQAAFQMQAKMPRTTLFDFIG